MIDRRFWRALNTRLQQDTHSSGVRRNLKAQRHAGKGGGEDSNDFAPPLARRERMAGPSSGKGQRDLLRQIVNQRVLYPLYLPKEGI